MCDCETRICDIFDSLVRGYFEETPQQRVQQPHELERRTHLLMELPRQPGETEYTFADLVLAARGIGYDPGKFMDELAERAGTTWVHRWEQGQIPNGWIRRMVLTQAELMLRERGANPTQTFQIPA